MLTVDGLKMSGLFLVTFPLNYWQNVRRLFFKYVMRGKFENIHIYYICANKD